MNGSKDERYFSGHEKLSKQLRLLYHCAICGETDYKKKKYHHRDNNKKNGDISNAVVLCIECNEGVHNGTHSIPSSFKTYEISKQKICNYIPGTVIKWFDKNEPIKIIENLPSKIGMEFRKKHVKGFKTPGQSFGKFLEIIEENKELIKRN